MGSGCGRPARTTRSANRISLELDFEENELMIYATWSDNSYRNCDGMAPRDNRFGDCAGMIMGE